MQFDMRHVIKQKTRNSQHFQIRISIRLAEFFDGRVLGIKSKRNKRMKSARLILKRPEAQNMINTILDGFNVPVKDGAIGTNPKAMRNSVNFEPILRGGFIGTN